MARSARGSQTSPAATQINDTLGSFGFAGYGATNFISPTAAVTAVARQAFSSTAAGTALQFYTTDIGTITKSARMTVDTNGNVGVGTTTPGYRLDVAGTINASSVLVNGVPVGTGSGSVSNITAGTGLTGGSISTTGTLNVDVGVTANQILQLNASAQIPAVDGSLLTGVNAAKIGGYAIATTSPSSGQYIGWNNSTSRWEPTATTTGTVTNIATGAGLTGGPISSTGTLAVDVGITANKIVQLDSSARLPAVDGSQLTNLAVTSSQWLTSGSNIYYNLGNVGVGTSTTTYNLSLNGQSAQTIGLNRQTASAGQSLTVQAGGAKSGGSNLDGGNLILSSGTSTGNGGSSISFKVAGKGYPGSGNSDHAPEEVMFIDSTGEVGISYTAQNTNNSYNGLTIYNDMNSSALTMTHDDGGLGLSNGDVVSQIDSWSKDSGNTPLKLAQVRTTIDNATAASVQSSLAFATMVGSTLGDRVTIKGANVGIGTATPQALLDLATTTSGQSAVIVPRDTTGNRPATGVNGMIRYNTTNAKFEAFENGAWTNMVGTGGTSSPWLTNGTSVYYNLGNVGIGTATPGAALEVNPGNLWLTRTINDAYGSNIILRKSRSAIVQNGDELGYLRFDGYDGAAYKPGANIGVIVDGTPGTNDMPGAMIFSTTPDGASALSERMRITNAGKVGIGTTSPARLLHVNGAARLTPTTTPTTPAAGDLFFDSAASNALKFYDGSTWQTVGTGAGAGDFMKNGSVAMTGNFNAGGNKVLGDTAASANLTLESTSNATKGNIYINPNGGKIGIGTNSVGATDFLAIENTGGQNVVIDRNATGSWVGIGAEPNTTFHVLSSDTTWGGAIFENTDNGAGATFATLNNAREVNTVGAGVGTSFMMRDSSTGRAEYGYFGAIIESNTASSQSGSIAFFPRKNNVRTETMRLTSSGNVGIGTTTPGYKLDVAGTINASSVLVNGVPVGTGSGSVSNITAGTGLTGGSISTTGTLNVDVGVTANQILQLNASAQIPAIDGSLLTSVNAAKIGGYAIATTSPSSGQYIGWNNTTSSWEPMATVAGTVTNIATDAGLTGGPISSTGTLAVDGSLLTNLAVTSSQWLTSGSNIYYNLGNVGTHIT